jgi:hypothetical protein
VTFSATALAKTTVDSLAWGTSPGLAYTASDVTAMTSFTVVLKDSYGNKVASDNTTEVVLSVQTGTAGLGGNLTRTASAGVVTFNNITYTKAESLKVRVTKDLLTLDSGSIVVAPASIDATKSSIARSGTGISADGVTKATVTVTIKDRFGNPVSGKAVTLSSTGSNNTLGQPSGTTNSSGQITGTLKTTTAEEKTIKIDTPAELTSLSVNVTFVSTSVVAAKSSITGTTPVLADGVASSTVSINLKDTNSNNVSGVTPDFTATDTNSRNSYGVCTVTDSNGNSTCSLKSTKAESKDLSISSPVTKVGGSVVFVAGAAAQIAKASGDTQTGTVGVALANVYKVLVTDSNSNPVSGKVINWAVATGSGSLSGASSSTDASGHAQISHTLGQTAGSGNNTVIATIDGTATSVTFSASAVANSTIASFEWVTAPAVSYVASSSSFMPTFSLKLKDTYGNFITADNSSQVVLSVQTGTGSLGGTLTKTASAGVVTFNNIRYPKAEDLIIRATMGAVFIDSAVITVSPGSATVIGKASGDTQTGTVGVALADVYKVLVTDSNSNPVSGKVINWAVATGSGSLSGASSSTDASGHAQISHTLGQTAGSGNNTVIATIDGTATSVTFSASAVANSTIASFEWVAVPAATYIASSSLPMQTFSVKLKDSYGNTIISDSSSQLVLSVKTGLGTLGGGLTKSAVSGVVTFNDITYTKADSLKLHLERSGLFIDSGMISVSPGPANKLVFSKEPISGAAGLPFGTQPQVQIQDANGNTITDGPDSMALITMSLESGSGTLSGTLASAAFAGVADWSNLKIDAYGAGKMLRATKSSTIVSGGTGVLVQNSMLFLNPQNNPNVPTGLVATVGSGTSLSWTAADGATSYEVFRGTSSGSLSPISTPTSTTFLDSTGIAGTLYYYAIRSLSVSGFSAGTAEIQATPIGAFSLVSAVASGGDKVTLSWGLAPGATAYTVKYGTTSGSYPNTASTTAISPYDVTGLESGDYYFMVTATNSIGNGAALEASVEKMASLSTVTAPSTITLSNPQISPSVNNRPSFLIGGVDNADTVRLYSDECVTEVGSAVASGATVIVGLTNELTSDGITTYKAQRTSAGKQSGCSSASFTYNYTGLSVLSTYSNAPNWNDYIRYSSPVDDLNHQVNTACDGSEGGYSGEYFSDNATTGCIHGGERRKVSITGYSSCTNLSLTENLGVFAWSECVLESGVPTFFSQGLAPGKGLRDLISNSGQWKDNFVDVKYSTVSVARSNRTAPWFNNTIVNLASGSTNNSNSTSIKSLGTVGAIYFVETSGLKSYGYSIGADKVSLITLGNSKLSKYEPGKSNNFRTNDCGSSGANQDLLICIAAQKFLWIEANLEGIDPTSGFGASSGIYAKGMKFSRIHASSIGSTSAQATVGALKFESSVSNLISGLRMSHVGFGAQFTTTSKTNIVRNLAIANVQGNDSTTRSLDVSSSSFSNKFYDLRVSHHSTQSSAAHAIEIRGDRNVFLRTHISNIKGSGSGLGLGCSGSTNCASENKFIQFVVAGADDSGIFLNGESIKDNLFMNVSAVNNRNTSVFFQGGSASSPTGYTGNTFVSVASANTGRAFASAPSNLSGSGNQFIDLYIDQSARALDITQSGFGTRARSFIYGNLAQACGADSAAGNADTRTGDLLCEDPTSSSGDLSNGFAGKVSVDDSKNPADTNGFAASIGSGDGYLQFESFFRGLGLDGSNFPHSDQRGFALGNFRIWDFTANRTGNLFNRSYAGTTANDPLNSDGSACGGNTVKASDTFVHKGIAFLRNAIEIDGDHVGNDDGLCSSNENCLWSPHIGAYQGQGDISAGYCTITGPTLTGIKVFQYRAY